MTSHGLSDQFMARLIFAALDRVGGGLTESIETFYGVTCYSCKLSRADERLSRPIPF